MNDDGIEQMKEQFSNSFLIVIKSMSEKFELDEITARKIAGFLTNDFLQFLNYDIQVSFNYRSFYLKRLLGSEFITKDRFSLSELTEIVKETRLSPIDRQIAELWVLEKRKEEEIAGKLNYDKRTIHDHIVQINKECRKTAINYLIKTKYTN